MKITQKVLKVFGLKRINLSLQQRFILFITITNEAKNLYQKALALEIQKKLNFKASEIKKCGIEITQIPEKENLLNLNLKKPLNRSFWITRDQREGILNVLKNMPAAKLEDWTFAEIASQLVNSKEEFWRLFNLDGEKPEGKNDD